MHLIHSRSWLCLSSVLLLLGCRDALSLAEPDLKVPQTANASISDAAHGGRPHFYFLPPLVPQPVYDSTFDAVRSPTVRICQVTNSTCGPLLAEYTTTSGPDSVMVQVDPIAEHYSVDWHTDRFALVDGSTYRIQVLIEGRQVGYVDLLRSGTDLKNAASGEVIQLVDGRTLPIRFRLEEGLERFRLVPAHAPDTVPDWIYDPANIESDSPLLAGSFLRNIVVVLFIPEATQAQRQSAVDLIGGEVVGGNWVTDDDGDYYVQIPEDGTAGPLLHAIELLEALPYVADAAPEFVEDPTGVTAYLRPKDGPGWQSWHINPADAAGEKWALEAISMPFAWGCETGSASSRVAVVDLGYHNASDFMTNVTNPGDAKLGYHQPDSLGHV